MYFLFNRTTFQIFVTYLTGALYVHPLWFHKHQHDNRVCSKLSVSCQRWWFQWRFAAILVNCAPSREMHNYCKPRIIKENFENFLIHRCNCILLSQVYRVWQVVKTPAIILNNPVFSENATYFRLSNPSSGQLLTHTAGKMQLILQQYDFVLIFCGDPTLQHGFYNKIVIS